MNAAFRSAPTIRYGGPLQQELAAGEWGSTVMCVATILRTECPLWVRNGHHPLTPAMSAFTSKADIASLSQYVRFVPQPD